MIEFEVDGRKYRTEKLAAMDQLHVARRVMPLLVELAPALSSLSALMDAGEAAPAGDSAPSAGDALKALSENLPPLMKALAAMSDQDVDYVMSKCLMPPLQIETTGGAWAPFMTRTGQVMDDTVALPSMMRVLYQVVQANLSGFFHAIP